MDGTALPHSSAPPIAGWLIEFGSITQPLRSICFGDLSATTGCSAPGLRFRTLALVVLPLVASPFASKSQVPTFHLIASDKLRPPQCRMPPRSVNRLRRGSSRSNDSLRFRHRPYAFDMSSVVPLRSSSCQSPDLVLPRPFPSALTTMAFLHSRRRWFGTCSCKPVPRGVPSSIKQLHTLGPPRPSVLVAHSHRHIGR